MKISNTLCVREVESISLIEGGVGHVNILLHLLHYKYHAGTACPEPFTNYNLEGSLHITCIP